MTPINNPSRIDVDFSLAIHNRTGKYFIGRDLIDTHSALLGDVYYWHLAKDEPPAGLFGRVIGRLQLLHIKGKTVGSPLGWLPRRRSLRPLLHLDPFTVPATVLRSQDAVLCHDLGPLTHPDMFDAEVCRIYRPIYDEIARIGPHLIFVSEASRAAFATLYPEARPRSVRIIYPAIREGIESLDSIGVAGVDRPFLLTVGSIGNRKNQIRCINAFKRSGLAERGIDYVLCGGQEPGFQDVLRAVEETPGVTCLPYISDAELSWLYASARGFVLLSVLEGFGMPVAEAISRGLVPLVSRDSVLHEVAGDGALLADAYDEAEIAAQMIALSNMDDIERSNRLGMLRGSTERFALERIRQDWRVVIDDMLSMAESTVKGASPVPD